MAWKNRPWWPSGLSLHVSNSSRDRSQVWIPPKAKIYMVAIAPAIIYLPTEYDIDRTESKMTCHYSNSSVWLFIWSFHHYFHNIIEWTSNCLNILILHFIENKCLLLLIDGDDHLIAFEENHPLSAFACRSLPLSLPLPPSLRCRLLNMVYKAMARSCIVFLVHHSRQYYKKDKVETGKWDLDPWSGKLLCWPLDHATPPML